MKDAIYITDDHRTPGGFAMTFIVRCREEVGPAHQATGRPCLYVGNTAGNYWQWLPIPDGDEPGKFIDDEAGGWAKYVYDDGGYVIFRLPTQDDLDELMRWEPETSVWDTEDLSDLQTALGPFFGVDC